MARVYNFSAGPSMLPLSVLERARDEMTDYAGSGQSVMEMSHRSKVYDGIIKSCEEKFRRVYGIPDDYAVLFLQGGASLQFTMLPMNLLTESKKADFVITGHWAERAFGEAAKLGTAREIASSKDKNFSYIPKLSRDMFDPQADYAHICYNNTIYGTAFPETPDTGDVPLAADMSSCILSRRIDVSRFGVIYAGAQKNMGPAGLTVVIIKRSLFERIPDALPGMLSYKVQDEKGSMLNTPPCYAIYVFSLVLDWLEQEMGGLDGMEKLNVKKAALLYDFIDNSAMFSNPVERASRSIMNITFVTGDAELDKKFVAESEAAGMVNLKGHRSVGGMRASLYNAMPFEGVEALVSFMAKFEKENRK